MRKLIAAMLVVTFLLCTSVLAVSTPTETATPTSTPVPDPSFVDAKVLTKVLDEGQAICGVRAEFSSEWMLGTLNTSSFGVNGYSVVQLYINNSGKIDHAEASGKYVFIIFDQPQGIGTGLANTLQYVSNRNVLRDISLNVQFISRQLMFEAKGYIHLEVDDLIADSYADSDGYETKYRLFVPEGWQDASLPLVIWLHGIGARGDDNLLQMITNRSALNYMSREAQLRHPSFVLAPQAQLGGWDEPAINNIHSIVLELIEKYGIDAARIYVGGASMGGGGNKSLMLAYPDMIAASLVVANANLSDDETRLAAYKDIPIVVITGAGDGGGTADGNMIANYELVTSLGYKAVAFLSEDGRNGFLRGYLAGKDLKPVVDAMISEGANWAFVTYLLDTVVPNAHWSWMAATENPALHDWMFAQVKATPYTGK